MNFLECGTCERVLQNSDVFDTHMKKVHGETLHSRLERLQRQGEIFLLNEKKNKQGQVKNNEKEEKIIEEDKETSEEDRQTNEEDKKTSEKDEKNCEGVKMTNEEEKDLEESEDEEEIVNVKTEIYSTKGKTKKFPDWEEVDEGEPAHQGMTIKGKSGAWIAAAGKIREELRNNINMEYKDKKGRTMIVVEAEKNKPFEVEVVTKSGERGKARIVMHNPSVKRGVTVQVTRCSGHDYKFVTCVAKKFVKLFLNLILTKGEEGRKEIIEMRKKYEKKMVSEIKPKKVSFKDLKEVGLTKETIKCTECGKVCQVGTGIKVHMTRMHNNIQKRDNSNSIKPIKPAEKRVWSESTEDVKKQAPKVNHKTSKCKICPFEAPNVNILNVHMTAKHNNTKCDQCDFSTKFVDRLNEHKIKKHTSFHGSELPKVNPDIVIQREEVGACEYCDEKFIEKSRLDIIQIKNTHYRTCIMKSPTRYIQREINCNKCNFFCKDEIQMKLHKRDYHDENSPSIAPKEKKFRQAENESVKNISNTMEKMEIEQDDINVEQFKVENMDTITEEEFLSKRMDKKVLAIQKKQDEEHLTLVEKLRKEAEFKKENEMKNDILKQKNKEFEHKRKRLIEREDKEDAKHDNKEEKEKVPERFRKMFTLRGFNIDDFCLIHTGGGGKCGAICISLHITHNSNSAQNVRESINSYISENWDDKFKNSVEFPYIERVGRGSRKFKDEQELQSFLLSDPDASLMWMTHNCLQAASNMQNMKINILTTGVVPELKWYICNPSPTEMMEHDENVHDKIETEECRLLRARWTILEPDTRCDKGDSKYKNEDMFILHEDDVHYSLMAVSVLYQPSIEQMCCTVSR